MQGAGKSGRGRRGSKYWLQIFDWVAQWSFDSKVCALTCADIHAHSQANKLCSPQLSLSWKETSGCFLKCTYTQSCTVLRQIYSLSCGHLLCECLSCRSFLTGFISTTHTHTCIHTCTPDWAPVGGFQASQHGQAKNTLHWKAESGLRRGPQAHEDQQKPS